MRSKVIAVRATPHHAFLRDLTRAYVLLLGAAAAAFLLFYLSSSWVPTPRLAEPPPVADDATPATRYTGSIMVDPPRGELCWERIFDNRTGRMWDNGYVKCDTQPAQLADARNAPAILNAWRMQEVGKAFRR